MIRQIDLEIEGLPLVKTGIFARHETFHPRFGWLKKGFDRAVADPGVFLREDATVRLGVGKNMVRSIRYWENAFKLLEAEQPSEFGLQLLGAEGWDSYLEDPASLWLLHWKLLEPPCYATAWDFTFNQFHPVEFTAEHLFDQLCDYRDCLSGRTADSSLRKDVSCLLRMYVEQPVKGYTGEESLDCPFSELGLIHTAGDDRHYTFRVGYKPSLSAEIIVYACLQYINQKLIGKRVPIAKLLYDPGSPGLVFKITESVLCNAIDEMARRHNGLGISDAAGKLEFFYEDEPAPMAEVILSKYYEKR